MALIGQMVLRIGAQTGDLSKGIGTAEKQIKGFAKSISSLTGSVTGLVGAFGAVAAAAGLSAVAGSIHHLIDSNREAIDVTSKTADAWGIASEQLIGWQYAASLSDLATEDLTKMVGTLGQRMGEMRAGTGEALKDIDKYGISLEHLLSLDTGSAFEYVVGKLSEIEDPALRAAAATDLLGKAGRSVGAQTFFKGGIEALKEAREHAEKLGLAFSQTEGRNVQAMNDSFTELGNILKGIGTRLTVEVAPYVAAVNQAFLKWYMDSVNVVDVIGNGIGKLSEILGGLLDGMEEQYAPWIKLGEIAVNVITSIVKWMDTFSTSSERTKFALFSMFPALGIIGKIYAYFNPQDGKKETWTEYFAKIREEAEKTKDEFRAMTDLKNAFNNDEETAREKGNKSITDIINNLEAKISAHAEGKDEESGFENIIKLRGLADENLIAKATELSKELHKLEEDKKEAQKKEQDDQKLKDRAKALADAVRTPVQKLADEIDEIEKIREKGLITKSQAEQFAKAAKDKFGSKFLDATPLQKLVNDLKEVQDAHLAGAITAEQRKTYEDQLKKNTKDEVAPKELGGALEFGTQAARSAALAKNNPTNKLWETAKETLKVLTESNTELKNISKKNSHKKKREVV